MNFKALKFCHFYVRDLLRWKRSMMFLENSLTETIMSGNGGKYETAFSQLSLTESVEAYENYCFSYHNNGVDIHDQLNENHFM